MTLNEFQNECWEWAQCAFPQYLEPEARYNRFRSEVYEVGELWPDVLHMLLLEKIGQSPVGIDPVEIRANLKAEVADVLITLNLLASSLGINLAEAVREKLDEAKQRYPEVSE